MNPHRTTGLLFALLLLGATTVPAAQAATASTTAAATRTADADDLRADAAPQFGITYTVRTAERFDFDFDAVSTSTSTASFSQRSDDPSTRRSAQNHTRWHNSKKHQHGYFLHGKFWRFFHERR